MIRGSDVLYLGDVFRTVAFPVIDRNNGGTLDGTIAALGMAGFLYGPSTLGLALAASGYLLVQSAWFLVPGARRRADCVPQVDAFEEAERRARGLLEGA